MPENVSVRRIPMKQKHWRLAAIENDGRHLHEIQRDDGSMFLDLLCQGKVPLYWRK
jgi:hypothetical protein